MKPRTFNSYFPAYNEEWAAKVLGIPRNLEGGPDLLAKNVCVEVKFRGLDKRNYLIWCVLDHQTRYPDSLAVLGFWALGTYRLNQDISMLKDIKDLDLGKIERELFLLDWDFISQFEPRLSKGKTALSKWNHMLRYPKGSYFPEDMIEVKSGHKGHVVKIAPSVDLSLFPNLQN